MHRLLNLITDAYKGKPFALRSPKWPEVERAHLDAEPRCQWCSGQMRPQVHHIAPFHLHPELELEQSNLITLCEDGGDLNCHFIHGHLRNWRSFNPYIREQCNSRCEVTT